jgi:tetratricopeptide (TPR) repeat protein
MNQSLPPSQDPDDLRQPSLESLKQQLRALPPPTVPDALPTKLIAAVPAAAGKASFTAGGTTKFWLWATGLAAAGILASVLVVTWIVRENSKSLPEPKANNNAAETPTTGSKALVSSKSLQQFEQAVHFDPFNADAWFNLAKAQAAEHRSEEAISSAEKGLDIANSRNNATLANTIEAWLRSYRAMQPGRFPQ